VKKIFLLFLASSTLSLSLNAMGDETPFSIQKQMECIQTHQAQADFWRMLGGTFVGTGMLLDRQINVPRLDQQGNVGRSGLMTCISALVMIGGGYIAIKATELHTRDAVKIEALEIRLAKAEKDECSNKLKKFMANK
jgi:hypothetical protein